MIVLLLYCLIHFIEAWLEVVVIALKNGNLYNYYELNKQEHFRSALLAFVWLLPGMEVCWYLEQWWIIPALPISRRIFFDYGLILLRRRPKHLYEGNDWWVNVFKKVFGKHGRLKELAITVIVTIALVVVHYFNSIHFW